MCIEDMNSGVSDAHLTAKNLEASVERIKPPALFQPFFGGNSAFKDVLVQIYPGKNHAMGGQRKEDLS